MAAAGGHADAGLGAGLRVVDDLNAAVSARRARAGLPSQVPAFVYRTLGRAGRQQKGPRLLAALDMSGARSWTRTNDPLINSQVL